MVQVLPLELCEQVIDCLAFDPEECQWEALAQCSLVCKSWVTRSRRYLWDVIVLSCGNDSDKLNQFLDFLHRSPTLAPLVTRFALHQYREPHDEGHPRGIIFSLLDALPSLEVLFLDSVQLDFSHAAEVAASLSSRVNTLSVKMTTFDDVIQFHNFVRALSSLDTLFCGVGVCWEGWDDVE